MLQALGRLHPLLVHFPIALLLAALWAELRRPRAEAKYGPGVAAFFCLALGTLGALAALVTGWLFATFDPPGMGELLVRHRWSGVATAAAATATWLSAWRWKRGAEVRAPTRAGLVLTALLVALTGALGGAMVYGEDFLLEPLQKRAAPAVEVLTPPPLDSPTAPSAEVPAAPSSSLASSLPRSLSSSPPSSSTSSSPSATAVDYLTEIRPLLERRCFECHGERKRPKGDLKLADMASVLARDPSKAVIVPGDPGASELYRRLTLPADDEDRMPPKGEPLAPAELELVRRWIAGGALWSAPPALPPQVDVPASPGLQLTPEQRTTRDAALARLRARGVRAQRVASSSDEVEVDLGVALPECGDAELALLAGLEPCLVELSLAHSAVGDAGLARLAPFHALRRLRLAHTSVGDAGLLALGPLPELESLDLFDTRVSDGSLAALRAFPRLARLYTGDTALGDAALDELHRARPDLAIERGRLPAPDAATDAPR